MAPLEEVTANKVGENKRRERGSANAGEREGAPHLSGMGEGRNIGTANNKRGGGGGGDQGFSPPQGLNSSTSKYPTSPAFTSRRSNGEVGVANMLGSSTNGGRRGEENTGNSKKEGRAEEGGWRSVGGSGRSVFCGSVWLITERGLRGFDVLS